MQWLSQGVLLLMVTPWQLDPCLGSHGGEPFVQIQMLHKSQEAWSLGQHAGVRRGFQSEAHTSQNRPCCHGTLARTLTSYLLLPRSPLEAYPRPRWLQPPDTFYSCWGLKERFSSLHPCSVGGSLTPKKMSQLSHDNQLCISKENWESQFCQNRDVLLKLPRDDEYLLSQLKALLRHRFLGSTPRVPVSEGLSGAWKTVLPTGSPLMLRQLVWDHSLRSPPLEPLSLVIRNNVKKANSSM